jgi:hypothetical protein
VRDYGAERLVRVARRCCRTCRRTMSLLPSDLMRRYRYGRTVIEAALRARGQGFSWEASADACVADGLVAVRVIRRWWLRFVVNAVDQQATPFTTASGGEILPPPADRRRPDLPHQDPWARGPTTKP